MPYILIRHQVEDYARWRTVFDSNIPFRESWGERSYQVYRNVNNPDDITLLLEWESTDRARQFLQSPELKEKMQASGVIGEPQVVIVEEVESGSMAIPDILI